MLMATTVDSVAERAKADIHWKLGPAEIGNFSATLLILWATQLLHGADRSDTSAAAIAVVVICGAQRGQRRVRLPGGGGGGSCRATTGTRRWCRAIRPGVRGVRVRVGQRGSSRWVVCDEPGVGLRLRRRAGGRGDRCAARRLHRRFAPRFTGRNRAMTHRIASLTALEILDSRGRPTVAVRLVLTDGATGPQGCPPARRPAPAKPSSCATATRRGTAAAESGKRSRT